MRANPTEFDLVAPGSLNGVLELLSKRPGEFLPVAGGTEVMVMMCTGRLQARRMVNLWGVQELRFIRAEGEGLAIGAGSTFTDIRHNPLIAREFPLLAETASWTGSIANQNRGTLGGNIVNASPAADTPPALLAYDADVELTSLRGTRRLPYRKFHLGYKRTALAADELVTGVHLKRRFTHHFQRVRKVGARNAQAISKVALAMVARIDQGRIAEIALGGASLYETPLRCVQTEAALLGLVPDAEAIKRACAALASEIKPIDDIRSTASYRIRVAQNLLAEFLRELAASTN